MAKSVILVWTYFAYLEDFVYMSDGNGGRVGVGLKMTKERAT